jgi:hypothetical protein
MNVRKRRVRRTKQLSTIERPPLENRHGPPAPCGASTDFSAIIEPVAGRVDRTRDGFHRGFVYTAPGDSISEIADSTLRTSPCATRSSGRSSPSASIGLASQTTM